MGSYKAQRNNSEEFVEKSAKEKKQESTEKAVDVIGETALDVYTGGQFSKVKNTLEKIPVVGNNVKNKWDKAVKKTSKLVSKTPVGNMAQKADQSGLTDAARSAKNIYNTASGSSDSANLSGNLNSSNGSNSSNVPKNNNFKFGGGKKSLLSSISNNKSNSASTKGSTISLNFNNLPFLLKLKIAAVAFFILLFLSMTFTVFSDDDNHNLELTEGSSSSSSSSSISAGSGSSDPASLLSGLETVAKWYIENVAVYDQNKYVQSPFSTNQVRADCTGFAVAYMSYISKTDVADSYSGEMVYPDGEWAKSVEALGWKSYTSDEIGELKAGDVLVARAGVLYSTKGNHAEIYIDSTHTFGWGSAKTKYPTNNTVSKSEFGGHVHFMDSSHDYITIYRYEGGSSSSGEPNPSATIDAIKMNDSTFNHGNKPKENQKYIMLHDTEMSQNAKEVATSWKNAGVGTAAHFVVDRDGTIVQTVELDIIAHHAGWGGPGDYDAKFGVGNNDGKGNGDDLVGQKKGDNWKSYTSYGMNSYSIGIEMCHKNGEDYPEVQLEAVDKVIAYIDSYYGFQSEIIDHKTWRPSNSDTDKKFATYLENYKNTRHH